MRKLRKCRRRPILKIHKVFGKSLASAEAAGLNYTHFVRGGGHPQNPWVPPFAEEKRRKPLNSITDFPAKSSTSSRSTHCSGGGNRRVRC